MKIGKAVRQDAVTPVRADAALAPAPESPSLLALRLSGDLDARESGRSLLVVAADDDSTALDATLELAWSLAEGLGHRVLLVDAAFGDRSLSAALGLADVAGLAEWLEAGDNPSRPFVESVRPTRHARIAVLPQGNAADASTIRAAAVRRLIELASAQYDFVVVFSSIATDLTRRLAFSSVVDAALLIAVEEQTTWDQLGRGQRLLNECGARRVALVLAHWAPNRRSAAR